jgi:hypothetical protein
MLNLFDIVVVGTSKWAKTYIVTKSPYKPSSFMALRRHRRCCDCTPYRRVMKMPEVQ